MKLLSILSLLAISATVFAAAETCTGAWHFNGDKPVRASSSFKTAPGCHTTGTGTLLFYIKDMAAKAREEGLSEVSIELMGTEFTKDITMIIDSTDAPEDIPLKFTMADSSMMGDDRVFMSLMGAFPKNSSIQIIRNSFTKYFDGPPVAAQTGYSLFSGPLPKFSLTGSEYIFARNNVTVTVVRGRTAMWSGDIQMTQNSRWIVAGNRITITPYCRRILLKHAGVWIAQTLTVTDSSILFDRNEFDMSSKCPLAYIPYMIRVDDVFHVIRGSMLWTNNNIRMVGNYLLGITPGSIPTSFLSFKSISNVNARMTLEYNSSFLVENNNMDITYGVVLSALPNVVIAISHSQHIYRNNCITLDNNRASFAMNAWNLGRTQLAGGALRFENTTLKVAERWPASFLWVDRISYLTGDNILTWNGNQQVKAAYNRPFETPLYFNRADFSGGVVEVMNNYLSATAPAYEGNFINLPRFVLNSGSNFKIINNYIEALCSSKFGAMRLALIGTRSDDWGSPMIAEKGQAGSAVNKVTVSCNKVRLVPHERHWRTPYTRLWTTVTSDASGWANGCTAKRMTSLVIEAGVNAAEIARSGYSIFDKNNRNSLFSDCLMPYVKFLNPVPACDIPTYKERCIKKTVTEDPDIPGYTTTTAAPTTTESTTTVAPVEPTNTTTPRPTDVPTELTNTTTTAKPADVPTEPATNTTTTAKPADVPTEPATNTTTTAKPADVPTEPATNTTTTAQSNGPPATSSTTAQSDAPVVVPAEPATSSTTAQSNGPVVVPAEPAASSTTATSTTTAQSNGPVVVPVVPAPNSTTANPADGPVIVPVPTDSKKPTPVGEHCITICSAAPLQTDGEVCPNDASANARVFGAQQEVRALEKTASGLVTRRDEVCVLCIVVPVISIVTLVIAIATGIIICHFNRCFRAHQKEVVA